MLRISLFAASLSACAFNDDGQLILCTESSCETDTTPPPVPPHPISFEFDQGRHQGFPEVRLARGGVMRLDVSTARPHTPSVTTDGTTLGLVPVSSQTKRVTVDVRGDAVGRGAIVATIPGEDAATLDVRVDELAQIHVGLPFATRSDHVIILPDIRELALSLKDVQGRPMIDHSLALAASTPGFTLEHWDALTPPTTAGDYEVALTRADRDVHIVGVRVVDRIDDIVGLNDTTVSSHLCVKAVVDGEQVETHGWAFRGTGLTLTPSTNSNCVEFTGATIAATITVEVAGMSKDFAIF